MLVISRKIGQEIVIDQNITLRVVRIHMGKVVLAFDAPREVNIRRGEIDERTDDDRK